MVLGAGPVGLLGAMMLVVAGVETYVFSLGTASRSKDHCCRGDGATYLSQERIRLAACYADEQHRSGVRGGRCLVPRLSSAETAKANSAFVFTGVPGRMPPASLIPIS